MSVICNQCQSSSRGGQLLPATLEGQYYMSSSWLSLKPWSASVRPSFRMANLLAHPLLRGGFRYKSDPTRKRNLEDRFWFAFSRKGRLPTISVIINMKNSSVLCCFVLLFVDFSSFWRSTMATYRTNSARSSVNFRRAACCILFRVSTYL